MSFAISFNDNLVVGVYKRIWQVYFIANFGVISYPTRHQKQKATLHVQKKSCISSFNGMFSVSFSCQVWLLVCLCCRLLFCLYRLSKVGSRLFVHNRNLHCQIFLLYSFSSKFRNVFQWQNVFR